MSDPNQIELDQLKLLDSHGPGASTSKDPLKAIKSDIQLLLQLFEKAPKSGLDVYDIRKTGWLFRKRSNSTWKKYWAVLDGDQLSFYSNSESATSKRHSSFTVIYTHTTQITKEDELTYTQLGKGQPPCTYRIMLVTPGRIIKLSSITDEEGKGWAEAFQKLLNLKYTQEELAEKDQIRKELEPLLKDQESMLEERYRIILRALTDTGFFIKDVAKEKEGYLELLKQTAKGQFTRKRLYAVLYSDFLYFFKPHEKPNIDTSPYDIINLRYITSLAALDDHTFEIKTPLRTFNLQAKHDVAVEEWINHINKFRTKKTKQYFAKEELKAVDNRGYHYSKPLEGRIILILQSGPEGIGSSSSSKTKKWKPKGSVITIGRSSTNTIQIEDKYVSRNHAKIEITNNVPYLIDLGSNSGTKLNGRRVLKHALKPGDVIHIGKTDLLFDVKEKESIFSQPIVDREEVSMEKKRKKTNKNVDEDVVELEDN